MSTETTIERVVLVGHCGPDTFMLRSAAQRALPGAQLVSINSDSELESYLEPRSLLLVNRVLDGAFAAADGIELVRQVRSGEGGPVAMLVSNFSDAQAAAEEAGAAPGFGKSEVGSPRFQERLRSAAGASATT